MKTLQIPLLICCIFTSLNLQPRTTLRGDDLTITKTPNAGTTVSCRNQIEFSGRVTLFSSDPKQDNSLALEVTSLQTFDHIAIDESNALRKYSSATADITVDGKKNTVELSPSNHQIALRLSKSDFDRPLQYFSTGGVLKQNEKELLTTPADLLSLSHLIHTDKIKTGQEWTPENRDVQAFLSLDNVIENRVKVSIKDIDSNQIAKVYLSGDVVGEVDGATSTIRILGVILYDLKSQYVQAFRGNLTESRAPSQLAPGFTGTIKIDSRCTFKNAKELSEDKVLQVAAQISQKQNTKLLWNSDSAFELIYDPKWKVILSDPEVVIMRYAEKGSMLAQCNVLRLPKRPIDRPLQLHEFRAQLEKTILGETGASIKHAQALMTKSGMNALQVVVSGTQEEIPIHWIYYHLSNAEGQCAAIVVTIEDALLRSFDQADLKLLESIRFVAPDKKQAARTDSEDTIRK